MCGVDLVQSLSSNEENKSQAFNHSLCSE